jgi:SAM-dependent methyltransferase
LRAPHSFGARVAYGERLEALQLSPLSAALLERAARVQHQLDAADERLFDRLRSRIARGRFTPGGLRRGLARHAHASEHSQSYDALDVLLAGVLDAGELPDESIVRDAEMIAYQPASGHVILGLLPHVQATDVFYDLGAGLGRVAILVALLSGARARGVEIEPAFCAYAEAVAQRLLVRGVDFVAADARDVPLEDGTVFFLYSPFRGALLRSVLGKLRALARRGPLRVCTHGPCTAEAGREPWLRRHSGTLEPHGLAVFHSV